jgi:hypothetical protein
MGQIYQLTKQLSGKKAQVNMPIKDKNNQYTNNRTRTIFKMEGTFSRSS